MSARPNGKRVTQPTIAEGGCVSVTAAPAIVSRCDKVAKAGRPVAGAGTRAEGVAVSRAKRANAFTLIELLVVVAIIALLIAILLPSLSSARDQARSIRCMANMRDMFTGVSTFAANHRGRFQLVSSEMGRSKADPDRTIYEYEPRLGAASPTLLVWPIVLLREEAIRTVRRNINWGQPSEQNARLAASRGMIRKYEVLTCPSDKIEFASTKYPNTCFGYLSYGINEDIVGSRTDNLLATDPPVWKNGMPGGQPGGGERLEGQLDRVVRPAEVAFFFDAGLRQSGEADNAQNLLTTRLAAGPLIEYCDLKWDRLPYQRHRRGSLNITYADGHGGFAKRVRKTPAPANPTVEPEWVYLPKTRISPYNSGKLPGR